MRSRARAGLGSRSPCSARQRVRVQLYSSCFVRQIAETRSASGPDLCLVARDGGMHVEQRAVGVEDENGRHGILQQRAAMVTKDCREGKGTRGCNRE